MTIEEAQTKWCCTHELEKCNANNCMAWRWFDTEIKNDRLLRFGRVRRGRSDGGNEG